MGSGFRGSEFRGLGVQGLGFRGSWFSRNTSKTVDFPLEAPVLHWEEHLEEAFILRQRPQVSGLGLRV